MRGASRGFGNRGVGSSVVPNGSCFTSAAWFPVIGYQLDRELISAAARRTKCRVLVDPPGMGESDLLPADAGVDFLAACLAQVLDEHGIDRAAVISASYGTPAAFTLAAQCPDRVDRVVLAGTMKELPSHLRTRIAGTIELALRHDRESLALECVDGMLCHDPRAEIDRRGSAARVLRSSIARMTDAELMKYAANTERLLNHEPLALTPRIRGPEALVFTGEHDVFSAPAACREVASAFDRGWFTTLRRADHLFHLQQWDAVSELILSFAARTLGSEETDGWLELEALHSPLDEPATGRASEVDARHRRRAGGAQSADFAGDPMPAGGPSGVSERRCAPAGGIARPAFPLSRD